jgi:hypothetical protein
VSPRLALIAQRISEVLARPEGRAELLGLVSLLSAHHSEALARIFELTEHAEPPRNLTPDEAAAVLGVTRRWMYEHAHELECTRRPSPGKLRFDSVGLQRLRDSRR